MQKQIIFLSIAICFLSITTHVAMAVSTTPTKSVEPTKKPTGESLSRQITNLKDKIASRVAELKLVEKKGIIGTVDEVKDLQITLVDLQGKPRFVDVDEITKFVASDNKSFGISDLKKGSLISIVGRYNKDSQRLLARFVGNITIPTFLNGTASDIDQNAFTFTLKSPDGKNISIDVENITKTQSYTKGGSVEKSGFSKIKNGDIIFVTGNPDKNDSKKIIATRILIIISGNEKATTITPTQTTKKPTPTPKEK